MIFFFDRQKPTVNVPSIPRRVTRSLSRMNSSLLTTEEEDQLPRERMKFDIDASNIESNRKSKLFEIDCNEFHKQIEQKDFSGRHRSHFLLSELDSGKKYEPRNNEKIKQEKFQKNVQATPIEIAHTYKNKDLIKLEWNKILQDQDAVKMKSVRLGDAVLVKWPSYPHWPAYIIQIFPTVFTVEVMFFGDRK